MADPFVGEIRAFCFDYTPASWAACNGTTIPVYQSQALYSIIGNTWGGTAGQSFGLPNLQAIAVMGWGNGPGLTPRPWASTAGSAAVTLGLAQIPNHTHSVNVQFPTSLSAAGVTGMPSPTVVPAQEFTTVKAYTNSGPNIQLAPQTIGYAGNPNGAQPHENRQPYLVLNYCICLDGEYPIRPS